MFLIAASCRTCSWRSATSDLGFPALVFLKCGFGDFAVFCAHQTLPAGDVMRTRGQLKVPSAMVSLTECVSAFCQPARDARVKCLDGAAAAALSLSTSRSTNLRCSDCTGRRFDRASRLKLEHLPPPAALGRYVHGEQGNPATATMTFFMSQNPLGKFSPSHIDLGFDPTMNIAQFQLGSEVKFARRPVEASSRRRTF